MTRKRRDHDHRKALPTVLGDKIRGWAAGYEAKGSAEDLARAAGLTQAADAVDLELEDNARKQLRERRTPAQRFRDAMAEITEAFLSVIEGPEATGPAEYVQSTEVADLVRRLPDLLTDPEPPAAPSAPLGVARAAVDDRTGALATPSGAMLAAVAMLSPAGATRAELTVLTGCKRRARDALLQALGERGYVQSNPRGMLVTDAGLSCLGPGYPRPPLGDALVRMWLARVPAPEATILRLVLDAGRGVHRTTIGEQTGMKRRTRDAHIRRLVARGLLSSDASGVSLSPAFEALIALGKG